MSGSFLNIDIWKVRNKISTAVRVDILAGLLYLFSRSKERVKRCGRDELPASSTAGQGRAGAEFVCECAVGPGTPLQSGYRMSCASPEVRKNAVM